MGWGVSGGGGVLYALVSLSFSFTWPSSQLRRQIQWWQQPPFFSVYSKKIHSRTIRNWSAYYSFTYFYLVEYSHFPFPPSLLTSLHVATGHRHHECLNFNHSFWITEFSSIEFRIWRLDEHILAHSLQQFFKKIIFVVILHPFLVQLQKRRKKRRKKNGKYWRVLLHSSSFIPFFAFLVFIKTSNYFSLFSLFSEGILNLSALLYKSSFFLTSFAEEQNGSSTFFSSTSAFFLWSTIITWAHFFQAYSWQQILLFIYNIFLHFFLCTS